MKNRKLAVGIAALTLIAAACSESEPAADATATTDGQAAQQDMAQDMGPPPPPDGVDADAPGTEVSHAATAEPAVIEGITNKRLSFAAGESSARVTGFITGDETIDYLVNVRSGQSMNISLATKNSATYFNLLEPGETEVATHIGSTAGNMFEGVAAKSGDYRIRVYMMRSAARRNEKADFGLEVVVD